MTANKAVYGRNEMYLNPEKYFFKGDDVRRKDNHSVHGTIAHTPMWKCAETVLVIVPEIRKSPIRYKQSEWEKI